MKPKLCVIIESPFAGDRVKNVEYARRCMMDSLKRNEAPFVSHLLYTQVLEDAAVEERTMGLSAGWAWIKKSQKTIVYIDYGISDGMRGGIAEAKCLKHKIEYRKIGRNPVTRSSSKI